MDDGTADGRALLGLGSNLDARHQLARARGALAATLGVVRLSTPRPSPPEGGGRGTYWNQLVEVSWRGTAEELRERCKRLEHDLGRRRTPGAPVAIDVDVLRVAGSEAEELRARAYWRPHLTELDE